MRTIAEAIAGVDRVVGLSEALAGKGVARLELFCRTPRPGWNAWGEMPAEMEGAAP